MNGGDVLRLDALEEHDQPEEQHKEHRARRTLFLMAHLLPDGRDAAENEPDEGEAGGQGVVLKAAGDDEAQAEQRQRHADDVGQQGDDAFPELSEQVRHAVNERIVDAHGHHHGAAAHAGDDVGDADDDTAQNVQQGLFHRTDRSFL